MHLPTFSAVSLLLFTTSVLGCSTGYRYCYQNLSAKDRGDPVKNAITTFLRHARTESGGKYIRMNEHYYIYKCNKGVLAIDSICYSCMGTYFRDDKCLDKKRQKPPMMDLGEKSQAAKDLEWFETEHGHGHEDEEDVKALRWSGRKMQEEGAGGVVKKGLNMEEID